MKKGFTLIELLAVIVILAIISIIATPIVLSIINDGKESALFRSAENYLSALEQSIAKKSMTIGSSYKPNTCEIQSDGNLLCDNKDVLEVKTTGIKPSDGRIIFENSKIIDFSLKLENNVVLKNSKNELTLGIFLKDYIKSLYTETTTAKVNEIEYSLDETHSLMKDRLGSKDVAKTDGNIRYYGSNPNNYIDIGDRDSEGNIIFWRIIGLFKDVEVTDELGNVIKTEDLIKIIRVDKLISGSVEYFSWDYKTDGIYTNVWQTSTLNLLLNGAYYNSIESSYNNNSLTPISLNFSSTGLSSVVHEKVERVNWNLGGHDTTAVYVDSMHTYERTGTNKWSGKIALMYPSDYGYSADLSVCKARLYEYSDSSCKNSNWLYEDTRLKWTLLASNQFENSVYSILSAGRLGVDGTYYMGIVRPVLYLNSDVSIVEEKETSDGIKYFVVE